MWDTEHTGRTREVPGVQLGTISQQLEVGHSGAAKVFWVEFAEV